MRKLVAKFGALVLGVFIISGCMSYTMFQTAEVNEPGEFSGGAGVFGYALSDIDTLGYYDEDSDSMQVYPWFAVFVRVGVIKNLDIGLKYVPPLNGMLDVKYQIISDPIMMSPSIGIGGTWAGWGARGGHDTTYSHSHLIERYDVYGQLFLGRKVGIWEFFIAPKLVRTAYHVEDKTRKYYHDELISEETTRDRRNDFIQYGFGAGFMVWKAIAEFDYMLSDEFNTFSLGLGFKSKLD